MILLRKISRITSIILVATAVQIARAHLVGTGPEYQVTNGPASLLSIVHADIPIGYSGGDGGGDSGGGSDCGAGGDSGGDCS